MAFFVKIFVMFAALFGIVFAIWKLNTTGIDASFFNIQEQEPASFDPEDVTHFEWKSTKKIFSYDRTKKGDWLPKKNEKRLIELFEYLSQIQLHTVEQKGASSLDVVLDINNVRWTGAWDGLSFVWKTGPHAGKGQILNEQKNMVFFKGAHIFDNVDFNLCKNRISKIYFQGNGTNYKIEQINNSWQVSQPETQTLNQVYIEKWIIGLCKVKLKTLLDLSYAQSNTKQGAITLEYLNGEKVSLLQVEKDFFVMQEMGMILDQLGNSLEDLKKHLSSPTNP